MESLRGCFSSHRLNVDILVIMENVCPFLSGNKTTEFLIYQHIPSCDGKNDCSDDSDELNCETLYWKNKLAYSKDIPPPKSKSTNAANKTSGNSALIYLKLKLH